MRCRFGCEQAHVYVMLDKGCYCFPGEQEMYLCMQHWVKLEPHGMAHAEDLEDSPFKNRGGMHDEAA
jgi:hypothetical protein